MKRYRIVTNGQNYRIQESAPRWVVMGVEIGTIWLGVYVSTMGGKSGLNIEYPTFDSISAAETWIELRLEQDAADAERERLKRYDTVIE